MDLAVARQSDLRHQDPAPARPRPPPGEDDVLHDGVEGHCAPGQHVLRHAALRQHHLLHLRGYYGRPGSACKQSVRLWSCFVFYTREVVDCLSGGHAVCGHTHVLTKVAGAGGHVPHVQGHTIRSCTCTCFYTYVGFY